MAAATATPISAREDFLKTLRDLDPILADVFTTVRDQHQEQRQWQHMWAGYQQERNVLIPDREADRIFQACSTAYPDDPDDPGTPETQAKEIASAIANPYHRMVDDYEQAERNWLNEMSFRLADDEPGYTARHRKSLEELLQDLRHNLAYAEALVTRGLMIQDQRPYAQGIAVLERVQDAV